MAGMLARKVGMTRIIDPENGQMTPVTLLEVPSLEVLQVKTVEQDGYSAVVLGGFERKNFGKNVNKKFKFIKEVTEFEGKDFKKGDTVKLEDLGEVDQVRLTGVSKGRGFAGVIKRHNFSRGPETHGSHHHREPGSVGMCAKPARILKGKKMPGRYGGKQISFRSVKVVQTDLERGLVAVKGGVPGAKNGFILLAA